MHSSRVLPGLLRGLLCLLVLYIGILPGVLNATEEPPDLEELAKKHLVYVEPTDMVVTKEDNQYTLVPYGERRTDWGYVVGVQYSTYEPIYYSPNFSNQSYRAIYGKAPLGMIEGLFLLKRNFSFGSAGLEGGVGMFQNDNTDITLVGSVLNLTPLRVGAVYQMDSLSKDPLWIPYVAVGAYVMIYRETLGTQAFGGNTEPAPYVTGGVAFPLDWLDPQASREGFQQSGIQSTSISLEARKYFASFNSKDPNFSNDVDFEVGLRVEF